MFIHGLFAVALSVADVTSFQTTLSGAMHLHYHQFFVSDDMSSKAFHALLSSQKVTALQAHSDLLNIRSVDPVVLCTSSKK